MLLGDCVSFFHRVHLVVLDIHAERRSVVLFKKDYVNKKCFKCRKRMTYRSLKKSFESGSCQAGCVLFTRLYHECGALIASDIGELIVPRVTTTPTKGE